MGDEGKTTVLAIDGGGSGCRLALLRNGERFEVTSGPANVSSDFGGAIVSLRAGLEALSEVAGMPHDDLVNVPAYLGLAGVVGPNDAVQVAHALPLTTARIESDQAATVEGALGDRDGAVAGLGTGSFFGIRMGADTRLSGGWGHRIDDRASGFWLGREALRAALTAEDGRAAHSRVSGAVLGRFGSAHAVVSFARDAGPEGMAALAAIVIEAAEHGDGVADDILRRGSAHILASLDAIGWTPELPICPIGGVAACYGSYLGETASLISPAGTPLDGALKRALRFSQGQI